MRITLLIVNSELTDRLIGLTVTQATAEAAARGLRLDIVMDMVIDLAIDPNRVHVRVEDDVVVQAWLDRVIS